MHQIEIDDADWQSLQYILVNASGAGITLAMTHRLLTKIGMQLQRAASNGGSNAVEGIGERSDSGALPARFAAEVAPPDHSDSAKQRPSGSSRR